MDNPSNDVLLLSAQGTGVNLQVLRGQQNFIRWARDFQVVAQARGLWDVISGRERAHAPPNADDYGFTEVDEGEDITAPTNEEDNGKEEATDSFQEEEHDVTTLTPVKVRKGTPSGRRSARFSLMPHEIEELLEANKAETARSKERAGPSESTKNKASTMDFSTRLSLYKFNLEAYEKSRKKLHQAMALLVCWVDPTIRGRLQHYQDPRNAWVYLQSQYRMSDVRALEIAWNQFDRINISRCKNAQDYLNEIENARQDITDANGMCTDEMIISKIV